MQGSVATDDEIQKLVAMGFEKVKLHHSAFSHN